MNNLESLRTYTTVVSDTGDIEAIAKYKPQDATTNPSLLAKAAQMPQYRGLVDEALRSSAGVSGDHAARTAAFMDKLAVNFGSEILKIIPGRVSTEVDAIYSFDTEGSIERARNFIALYEKAGISRDRILIKLGSTWEGIRAAERLEREGIHCNLTLLFSFAQAVACAEAKVTLISPFVGRILDWYKKDTGKDYTAAEDPGVVSVTTIYNYYKKFDYKTEVMGASFRNIGEIKELAGSDLLTIAPKLLEELQNEKGELPRKLDPARAKKLNIERIPMDQATFEKMHAADRMAHDKLKEGIEGFSKALEELEQLLAKRLKELAA